MNPKASPPSSSPLQDIPRWTQAYARNRVLNGAYVMGIFMVLSVGCYFSPQLSSYFRRSGHAELDWIGTGLFWLCYAGLGAMVLVVNAAKLERFEEELARVPSSAWGDIVAAFRAAGSILSTLHFTLWLVVCPIALLGGNKLLHSGQQTLAYILFGVGFLGVAGLSQIWMLRQGSGIASYWTSLGRWISPGEGVAAPAAPLKVIWVDYLVGFAFLLAVSLSVVLGLLERLPIEWMQPVSALFVIPLVLYGALRSRGHAGIWPWLFITLYGLHALLICAGAPIVFRGEWESLNMLLPVGGYGILSALVAHAYSKRALRKLRTLAAVPPEIETGEGNREL